MGSLLCNDGLVTCTVIPQKQAGFLIAYVLLPGILSGGILPLAVCQSMDHGRTAEAVTTDTFFFFFQKMCPGLKSNLV